MDVGIDKLPDACNDRMLSEGDCPTIARNISSKVLFKDDKVDWKTLRQFFFLQGALKKDQCMKILMKVLKVFQDEPNMIKTSEPIAILGDIHGQYYDLCQYFENYGDPSQKLKYLFMGDYVDRGVQGVQCCLLLFAMKIEMHKEVLLLRGNHESRNMTEMFTFRDEVLDTPGYDEEVYEMFMDVFDAIPMACKVDNKYLAMHGGISPDIKKLEDINTVNRFQEIPLEGMMCDLAWSDPADDKNCMYNDWEENRARDCSYYFGRDPTRDFLDNNKLTTIYRGHQVKQGGYQQHKWDGPNKPPLVITVFSAPNYCGTYANKGGIVLI